jgi:hypothetical protein
MSDLRHCPHCGSEPWMLDKAAGRQRGDYLFVVTCIKCDYSPGDWTRELEASIYWNTHIPATHMEMTL